MCRDIEHGGRRCDCDTSAARRRRRARAKQRAASDQVTAYIGATPYRPESAAVVSMSARPSYYDSDEWIEYDDYIHDAADRHGVTIVSAQRADGLWLGETEPAGAYTVRADSTAQLHAWAAEVAGRYNQDSVMVSRATARGRGRLATYGAGGVDAEAALSTLRAAGLPGGRVVDGRLQIVSTPDAPLPGAAHALLDARFGHEATDRVSTTFVTKSLDHLRHSPIKDIQRIRQLYCDHHGLPTPRPLPHLTEADDIAAAQFYDQAAHEPTNPRVARSYRVLRQHITQQYNTLIDEGYHFEPWDETAQHTAREREVFAARRRAIAEGKNPNRAEAQVRRRPLPEQPYSDSAAMLADLRKRKHLYYFRTEVSQGTEGALPPDHPMAATVTVHVPLQRYRSGPRKGEPKPGQETTQHLVANDVFRAVHDAIAHSNGFQFGPRGERRAWWTHRNCLPSEARVALWNETRAQNVWTNAGPHMQVRTADGVTRLATIDDPQWVPLTQRPYAEQKCVDAPSWLV